MKELAFFVILIALSEAVAQYSVKKYTLIMAGHSHWAGIKHKKGKADKQRSKIFSKLSKEITVAAKLGDKDPVINPRLRSAIQAARSANMPKDNIERAINKSSINTESVSYTHLTLPTTA